jgi:CBS domain-containing protein
MDAIHAMAGSKVGSVVVVDGDALEGIFSERDVMLRIVGKVGIPKQPSSKK